MKAEHINSFILSACKVMRDMCMIDLDWKAEYQKRRIPDGFVID